MRTILILILIFSFSLVKAKEFEHFTVKNTQYSIKNIIPNFKEEPNFDSMEKGLMPKKMEDYTKSILETKFPDLFSKVENFLGENERLNFLYFYNEKGEVIYGYFACSEAVIEKLTDELLLEIYNTFMGMKIEVDPSTVKSGYRMYEILNTPFRGK